MKKAVALMAVLLVASMVFVFTNLSDISKDKENILFWEEVSHGDPAFVSDLRVNTWTNYRDSIYWNSKINLGHLEKSKTKIFFKEPKEKREDEQNARVSVQNYDYRGVYLKMKYKFGEETDDFVPEANRYEEIIMKDYFEFYPISLYLEFPGAQFSVSTASNYDYYDRYIDGDAGQKYDMLDYFKIPVLEEEKYIADNQYRYDTDLPGEPESDYYHPATFNVLTDEACLFTFDIHSNGGKVMDTSFMKGGYGIYRLPYKMVDQEDSVVQKPLIAVGEFAMVYPLSTDMEIISFELNDDKTHLQIVSVENNEFTLTVIDARTLETLKVITLGEGSPKSHQFLYTEDEEYMALVNYDTNKISLIATPKNGNYEVVFTSDLLPEGNDSPHLDDYQLIFDGERLALVGIVPLYYPEMVGAEVDYPYYYDGYDEYEPPYFPSTRFFVSAYNSAGLQYYGEYDCSLTDPELPEKENYDFESAYFYKLTASWR